VKLRLADVGRDLYPTDDGAVAGARQGEAAAVPCEDDGEAEEEMAQKLYLTEATVKTHVGAVYFKLDLRDRAQAVVFAYECGLVRAGR